MSFTARRSLRLAAVLTAGLGLASIASAGPPLICHPFTTSRGAPLLPWADGTNNWRVILISCLLRMEPTRPDVRGTFAEAFGERATPRTSTRAVRFPGPIWEQVTSEALLEAAAVLRTRQLEPSQYGGLALRRRLELGSLKV